MGMAWVWASNVGLCFQLHGQFRRLDCDRGLSHHVRDANRKDCYFKIQNRVCDAKVRRDQNEDSLSPYVITGALQTTVCQTLRVKGMVVI